MKTGRPLIPIKLNETEMEKLQSIARSRSSRSDLVLRSKIILLSNEGLGSPQISKRLHLSEQSICKWKKRFLAGGMEALSDELRSGRPRTVSEQRVAELLQKTIGTKPKAENRWSCRSFALEHRISKSTVQRLWSVCGLQPHRHESFTLSTDPLFVEKVRDVVGLYLNPPDKALVLCVDEKSQCQALERTQPSLPMGLGYLQGYTHDYHRHGTTTLFAALEVATGKILAQCKKNHRHEDFINFLRHIDSNTPSQFDLHVIIDNYSTHKHTRVKTWLARHPRFHFHFIPTYSSWLNQVEIFFGIITRKAIRNSSFQSVKDLVEHIGRFVDSYNQNSKPFAWTATAESIMMKLEKLISLISGTQH